jgi:flagellar biogenesis protein FliO
LYTRPSEEVKIMELTVDLIEGLAVIVVVCWLVYKFFSPPSRPMPRGPEKMSEPWWKLLH